jgi:endonuclease YncB( thermonuclease family)
MRRLILAFSLFSSAAFAGTPDYDKCIYSYAAVVDKVVDGDTFDATVDLGFGVSLHERFRLYGADAPELNQPNGKVARTAVAAMILNTPVFLQVCKRDGFRRWLTVVYVQVKGQMVDLVDYMHERGLVKRVMKP